MSEDHLLLLGRFFITFIFLYSGIEKAIHFKNGLAEVNAKNIPFPHLALLGTIVLQIVCSLVILAGHFLLLASVALSVFTLATAVVFYDFWNKNSPERPAMLNGF